MPYIICKRSIVPYVIGSFDDTFIEFLVTTANINNVGIGLLQLLLKLSYRQSLIGLFESFLEWKRLMLVFCDNVKEVLWWIRHAVQNLSSELLFGVKL
jgi:hypothetical protein